MVCGIAITALLLGCREEAPVLTGIPTTPLLEGTASAEERRDQIESDLPEAIEAPYEKPAGVYLDACLLYTSDAADE